MEIVRIFEKHGFIWGGRWYHYDTMHFEYRPELSCDSRPAMSRGAARVEPRQPASRSMIGGPDTFAAAKRLRRPWRDLLYAPLRRAMLPR